MTRTIIYAKDIPSIEVINEFYTKCELMDDYWRDIVDKAEKGNFIKHKSNKKLVSLINSHASGFDRVLDIGSSYGLLLSQLKPFFREVEGVELNRDMAEVGSKKYGIRIYQEDLMETDLIRGAYDVVTLNQVIEHLPDFKMFTKIRELLNEGGIVYVGTPNVDGLSMKVFRNKHAHLYSFTHLSLFNMKSMKYFSEKFGFSIKYLKTVDKMDISLMDLLYYYLNRSNFVHRANYNIVLTPFLGILSRSLNSLFTYSGMPKRLDMGSYLEVILQK